MIALKQKLLLEVIKGSVFHVQRMSAMWFAQDLCRRGVVVSMHPSNRWAAMAWVVLGMGVSAGMMDNVRVVQADDTPCIDFYTIGESRCQPQKSQVSASGAPQLLVPADEADKEKKVDEFLQNYGKPPREFVEFYMNPTPENAQKWVKAYQGILQKSQNLSRMWEDAETLYSQQGDAPAVRRSAPAANTLAPVQPAVVAPASPPRVQASPMGNFGGLNLVAVPSASGGVLPQDRGVKLTYYFSQTCPYCARMTPELAVLTMNYKGKLEFTCVDITPNSNGVAPSPDYLRDKLACQWRLPQQGELQQQSISMTPTLFIQRGQDAPVKLSGYMSQEQLRAYLSQ